MGITIKECPWCGSSSALLVPRPLGGPRGTGYPGCYEYVVQCFNCKAEAPNGRTDDIYCSSEEAQQQAIEAWNRRK